MNSSEFRQPKSMTGRRTRGCRCAGVKRCVNRAADDHAYDAHPPVSRLASPRRVLTRVSPARSRGPRREATQSDSDTRWYAVRLLLELMFPWYTSDQDVCANRVPRRPLRVRTYAATRVPRSFVAPVLSSSPSIASMPTTCCSHRMLHFSQAA